LPAQSLIFRTICQKNGLQFSDGTLNFFSRYADLLLEWNSKINLISRKDTDQIWSRHFLGSVSFLFLFSLREKSSVIDIGTGGGLPGIPVAFLCPSLRITLVDSIQKKMVAVADIVDKLKLLNVDIVHSRAEDLPKKKIHAGAYDYVLARAVAPVEDLIAWGKPLLKQKTGTGTVAGGSETKEILPGSLVLLKGGDVSAEVERARVVHRPASVEIHPLLFDAGQAAGELVDKKVIIIRP
jgi:16S rRNA (guanine527-N7)-methyltransferase